MKKVFTLLFIALIQPVFGQSWKDQHLPADQRSALLLKELTTSEKISWLMHENPAIPRLGLPGYNWWNEALHGVARNGKATVFPQAINLAATFDTSLVYEIGQVISTEARAKYNIARQHKLSTGNYAGLTFWSPNINIFRDPRWGRGQETYGEDPWLTSRIGVAFVQGLQGKDPAHPRVAACAKHFAVHSGPEGQRHSFNAFPSKKDFAETYTPAFRSLVTEGHVRGIMCAYNRLNNAPCCGSDSLLNRLLREEWGFDGYVVTDCGAIWDMVHFHHLYTSMDQAAALALKNGVNLDCGSEFQSLHAALEKGLIQKSMIDSALFPLLQLKFELGVLDSIGSHPLDQLGEKDVASAQHQNLALRAAENSLVLLENKSTLPLSLQTKSIAIVGPLAFEPRVLLGNYHGWSSHLSTILEGITGAAPVNIHLQYEPGFNLYPSATEPLPSIPTFNDVETIILTLGMNTLMQGEDGDAKYSAAHGDLSSLLLPENQLFFLQNLRKTFKGKIVVLLFSGSPLITSTIKANCDALIWCGYPGEAGGQAIGNILFGKKSPCGKLPFSFPVSEKDLPAFDDYSMKNRTYAFCEKAPEYSFGYGKTYLDCHITAIQNYPLDHGKYNVTIQNKSDWEGKEILQVYLRPLSPQKDEAHYRLVSFCTIPIKANSTATFPIIADSSLWFTYDANGDKHALEGTYEIIFSFNGPTDSSAEKRVITFTQED